MMIVDNAHNFINLNIKLNKNRWVNGANIANIANIFSINVYFHKYK